MVLEPGELVEPSSLALEIDLITATEIDAANQILATCFGAPEELFDRFCGVCAAIDEGCWYVGRVDGEIVATALGITMTG